MATGGTRGGLITYWRRLSATRGVGWQFQENQLRLQITIEDDKLQGGMHRSEREAIVEAEYLDFFDHADVEAVLGPELKAKTYAPRKWLGFNPDFVYRHRPVLPSVSTSNLVDH